MAFRNEELLLQSQVYLPAADRMARQFDHITEDAAASVTAAGYFNDARHRLAVGDLIRSSHGIGGTHAFALLKVATVPAEGSNVTVAAQLL